jgi:hypothetical protein
MDTDIHHVGHAISLFYTFRLALHPIPGVSVLIRFAFLNVLTGLKLAHQNKIVQLQKSFLKHTLF